MACPGIAKVKATAFVIIYLYNTGKFSRGKEITEQ